MQKIHTLALCESMEAENKYVRCLVDNGILYCIYKPGLKISLPLAQELVQFRLGFILDQVYPTLVDIRAIKSVTKEAREYLGGDEAYKGIKACALLVESPFTKFLGNFFIQINKPKVITQIFSRESEAISWLSHYK